MVRAKRADCQAFPVGRFNHSAVQIANGDCVERVVRHRLKVQSLRR
jgi:hypothetical protein